LISIQSNTEFTIIPKRRQSYWL